MRITEVFYLIEVCVSIPPFIVILVVHTLVCIWHSFYQQFCLQVEEGQGSWIGMQIHLTRALFRVTSISNYVYACSLIHVNICE